MAVAVCSLAWMIAMAIGTASLVARRFGKQRVSSF